ncbi:hypothetical protein FOVG_10126 [Fusarium oxysporum f. sp. pisi HDV247]|uniref:Uncharacterized protein n=1 Tax=Fusarium oxysporum f. sp. pisi HDV247 TaxID=1080344 RepID=W9P916_FUSOX|nr:hypothetical protein FOVG_10126 [Fusarium oxysporum f. sp. pisi HDV247]
MRFVAERAELEQRDNIGKKPESVKFASYVALGASGLEAPYKN